MVTGTTRTLTLGRADLAQVRRGDRVTAIDGRPAGPYRVTGRYAPVTAGGAQGIPMVRTDNGITLNLYPDTHVERHITIERTVRAATRTVGGVRFTYDGEQWHPDGSRYVVSYEDAGVTTCEQAHPVRDAAGRGYLCAGQESHVYKMWMAIDATDHGATPHYFDTFTHAAQTVAGWVTTRR